MPRTRVFLKQKPMEKVPCKWCGLMTSYVDTRTCPRDADLYRQVEAHPDVVELMLDDVMARKPHAA